MQEDGDTSSTDVAEPATDDTEIYETANESVSVEQGQLLRAVETDQGVLKVETQRQSSSRVHALAAESLVYSMYLWKGR